jgi:hypothetical protein
MVRTLVVLALLVAPSWRVVEGKRFDVHARTASAARRVSREAEEAAERFVGLFGSFPGERAAVVLTSTGERGDDPGPDWRKGGAAWEFRFSRGRLIRVGPADDRRPRLLPPEAVAEPPFRGPLGVRMLLEWSDLRAPDPPRGDGSGTRLPDWWEDAVAGWCGDRAARGDLRAAFALALARGKSLPLDRMLALVRAADPGYLDLPGIDLDPGLVGPRVPKELLDALRRPGRAPVLPSQALSFLEYLVEVEGPAFVRHAADLQARGLGLPNALPWLERNPEERARPRTPVPKSLREMEKAWLAWAAARR